MNQQIITVSEFLSILNETLSFAYPEVIIEGEVSSFKVNQGKWVFFDLKDKDSTLSCFMPLFALKLPIEDGMKIRVTGSPKLTNWGKFSFTVRQVEIAGEGELKRAMALLRTKLEKEGLFDAERKRDIPSYPKRIGLITSGTSAAYSDFIKILQSRWSPVDIVLADIQVQGAAAPDQIVNALDYFNSGAEQVDTIVLIRGGGSLEDLQAFSTEPVARAVAASRTPIIVGVGHEIDSSLADYAADLRAATPTDAARLVAPDRHDILRQVANMEAIITHSLKRRIEETSHRLDRSVAQMSRITTDLRVKIETFISRITLSYERYFVTTRQAINSNHRILSSHNPMTILERGYAIVRQDNVILKAPTQAVNDSDLVIQLAKGELRARPTQAK
ncbi:MAG: exodeoxyribonuclease VII large subunit [Candidatus Saccharibacteria bacterium]